MRLLLSFLILLFTVAIAPAQVPELGLLPPQAHIFKEITTGKGLMSMTDMVEMAKKRSQRNESRISGFTGPLEAKITKLLPRWLKASGAKNLATLEWSGKSEVEKEEYLKFHNEYVYLQGFDTGGMNINRKNLEKQNSVYFREESNKLANEIDRDYLIIVDVYGYHSVSKKKSKERVDPDKLKGNVTLVVSIVNAATGVAEVTKRKSTEGRNPGKISEEDLLKDLESLVDKVYQKFVKNFKE